MRRLIVCLLPVFLLLTAIVVPQPLPDHLKTEIKDQAARAKLLGAHRLSLQWISWDYFGKAMVTEKNGTLYLKGEQKSRQGNDSVKIDGIITTIEAKSFTFVGTIITQVSHNNDGKPCKRAGEMM